MPMNDSLSNPSIYRNVGCWNACDLYWNNYENRSTNINGFGICNIHSLTVVFIKERYRVLFEKTQFRSKKSITTLLIESGFIPFL